jgi:hypothetical protein
MARMRVSTETPCSSASRWRSPNTLAGHSIRTSAHGTFMAHAPSFAGVRTSSGNRPELPNSFADVRSSPPKSTLFCFPS